MRAAVGSTPIHSRLSGLTISVRFSLFVNRQSSIVNRNKVYLWKIMTYWQIWLDDI
jgi:hypothetical protein